METIIKLDMFRLMDDVRTIARPIANNKGLSGDVEDIYQETYTRILEDHRRYEHNPDYLDKLSSKQYYNTMIRNKAIAVCELWSDPFCYYYEPWWVSANIERLLFEGAESETQAMEVADFARAYDTLTDRQRQAILNGRRSGTAFNKLVRNMNKGKPVVPYGDVSDLD